MGWVPLFLQAYRRRPQLHARTGVQKRKAPSLQLICVYALGQSIVGLETGKMTVKSHKQQITLRRMLCWLKPLSFVFQSISRRNMMNKLVREKQVQVPAKNTLITQHWKDLKKTGRLR